MKIIILIQIINILYTFKLKEIVEVRNTEYVNIDVALCCFFLPCCKLNPLAG